MYASGQQQLQSASWLNQYSNDRPSFHAVVCRTWSPNRPFQVFVMSQGLLFVESRNKIGNVGGGNSNAIVVGAVLGGAIGACIGAAIAANSRGDGGQHENLDTCSEEQLFQLAATRRRSFAAKNDEILSVTIDAPGSWSRLMAPSTLAGWVTVRDRKLGKVTMEVHDQAALSVAVDSLARRYAERAFINVELDRNTARFNPLGR
jgi:hypothetical protein